MGVGFGPRTKGFYPTTCQYYPLVFGVSHISRQFHPACYMFMSHQKEDTFDIFFKNF